MVASHLALFGAVNRRFATWTLHFVCLKRGVPATSLTEKGVFDHEKTVIAADTHIPQTTKSFQGFQKFLKL